MKLVRMLLPVAALVLSAGPTLAGGRYVCYGATYENGRCSDGGIPVFIAESVQPTPTPRPDPEQQTQPPTAARDIAALLGVWDTNVPSSVITRYSRALDREFVSVAPGARGRLLKIKPDGTWVWQSYGGKRGTWRRNPDPKGYPILLDDPSENATWGVGPDTRDSRGDIIIQKASGVYYVGRRVR